VYVACALSHNRVTRTQQCRVNGTSSQLVSVDVDGGWNPLAQPAIGLLRRLRAAVISTSVASELAGVGFFAPSKISLICLIAGGSSASMFAAICGPRIPLQQPCRKPGCCGAHDKVNGKMPQVQRVRKLVLLTKELDHDDSEASATMKVRRKAITDKYADVIDAI